MSTLEDQIQLARKTIQADNISMSVSEVTSLFKEGVLVIQPEFQRLFRWSDDQKSRLVESILLGIPLPSIFISQEEESGKWELVDGLQRISTLLELQGLFPGPDGNRPPLRLRATSYLPELEGRYWGDGSGSSLSTAQMLDIRLSRLDLRIIKRGSDSNAKFDLFQRLNSYGSPLTAQEIRTAFMVGLNPDVLPWIQSLATYPPFVNSLSLSDRLIEEQFDIDLTLRFLMLHDQRFGPGKSSIKDFPTKLDNWSTKFSKSFPENSIEFERTFKLTFDAIEAHGSSELFKKWDQKKSRFVGGFSSSSYEAIAIGLGYHIAHGNDYRRDLIAAAKELWSKEIPEKMRTTTGLPTGDRISRTVPLGRELLREERATESPS